MHSVPGLVFRNKHKPRWQLHESVTVYQTADIMNELEKDRPIT